MNAIFPRPPALFCRVDMVLCMFKNSQPPTQPSAITPRVGKFFERPCNQIPPMLQKVCSSNFGKSRKLRQEMQQSHSCILPSYQFWKSRSKDEIGITMLQHADNKPSPPPSLWSAVRGSVGLDLAWQLYKAPSFQAHRICLLWILVLLRTSRKRIIFLCN